MDNNFTDFFNQMDSFDNSWWDSIDCTSFDLIGDVASSDFKDLISQSAVQEFDAPLTNGVVSQGEECAEKECSRKRGRSESCGRLGSKACRERQRRERMNERFLELSSTLEPQRPATTDKSAILGDAIRVLNQLNTEIEELKESKERLQEEIRTLKAEKNELRKEKHALKADKALLEHQMKAMTVPPAGFMPAHPGAAYQALSNNMPVYPSYGVYPMWHYLPPSVRDTSRDHELRPPAA